ncbi:MAG: hypothetical protein Q9227_000189 [Pyrenula ochraceoflavens]
MPALTGYHPNGSPSAAQEFEFGPIVSAKLQGNNETKHSPEEEEGREPPSVPAKSLTNKDAEIAEFFSQKTFQLVLHNPTTAHQLSKFSQDRLCGENMEFLKKVDRYNSLLDEVNKTISEIHREYVAPDAPRPLNLPASRMKQMGIDVKDTTGMTLPAMELIFSDAQEQIEDLLATDIYPRFVKHQMTTSAVQALGNDRGKYAGLGDCFVLTNPAIADNPIVYASDGFVKVTGYARNEIIPRNCRFLQGDYTDKSTEKWAALLESTLPPLMDRNGKIAFFLGGQINCSTTVHSHSDIMRVLSTQEEAEQDEDLPAMSLPSAANQNRYTGLFKAFKRTKSSTDGVSLHQNAGMEGDLVNRIERMKFKDQVDQFYTAYSKYLILTYESFAIEFYSPSFFDMLCLSPTASVSFAGSNVFQVLKEHLANTPRDYKNRVKTALRLGRAISVDVHMMTRQSVARGKAEKVAMHWTPLKDDQGMVQYVVLTLGFR